MRIIVSLPGLSSKFLGYSETEFFQESSSFDPSKRNLDVFEDELRGVLIKDLFGINIPGWSLAERGGTGVSGPGRGELWIPPSLQKIFQKEAGIYDRWRPYPARPPLSTYSINMAKRFSSKRCKILAKVAEDMKWDTIFYVEHGPASIAHLSENRAFEIAKKIVHCVARVSMSMPYVDVIIFSPYGIGTKQGFVVSNRIVANKLNSWPKLRAYLKGHADEDIGH